MRYFVLLPEEGGLPSHIVGEIVCESNDGANRELSLAGSIAGARSLIMTEKELGSSAAGREALSRWVRGDDAVFDDHTARILSRLETERRPGRVHLRLVRRGVAAQVRESSRVSADYEYVLARCRDLIEESRRLIDLSRGARLGQVTAETAEIGGG